jgi:hypothetical protein
VGLFFPQVVIHVTESSLNLAGSLFFIHSKNMLEQSMAPLELPARVNSIKYTLYETCGKQIGGSFLPASCHPCDRIITQPCGKFVLHHFILARQEREFDPLAG